MKYSDICKSAGLQSLADYIKENFDGNQSAFGRAHDLQRAQVQQYLNAKKPVFVVCGKLVQVIRDLEYTEDINARN